MRARYWTRNIKWQWWLILTGNLTIWNTDRPARTMQNYLKLYLLNKLPYTKILSVSFSHRGSFAQYSIFSSSSSSKTLYWLSFRSEVEYFTRRGNSAMPAPNLSSQVRISAKQFFLTPTNEMMSSSFKFVRCCHNCFLVFHWNISYLLRRTTTTQKFLLLDWSSESLNESKEAYTGWNASGICAVQWKYFGTNHFCLSF